MTFNEAWPAAQSNPTKLVPLHLLFPFHRLVVGSSPSPFTKSYKYEYVFVSIGTENRHAFSQDLHRTGCSLFCGAAGRDNQAVLRRVLLGFARWNKSVGYCQGLNVLAALVLQVMDRAESAAVKVMIYLIEGVLPEGYFADNLRGLSVDMAVFRDLLRARLPKLSKHLEALQNDAKDKATGNQTGCAIVTLFARFARNEATVRGGSSHR